MSGLVDYGIIDPNQTNALARGYDASVDRRMATEEQQTKLDQLKSDRQTMVQLQEQLKAANKDPDLNKVFDALIATGRPDYVMHGLEGKQRLKAQMDFERTGRDLYPELFGGAAPPPTAPGAPAVPTPGGGEGAALGTGLYGTGVMAPTAPTNALAPTAPTNALAPAAPTNALAKTPEQLRREIMFFSQSTDPRAKAMAGVLTSQLTEMTKPHVVGSNLVTGAGQTIFTAPPTAQPTTLSRLYAERDALPPNDPRRATYDALIRKETTHAPGTNVNIDTSGKKYGERFGTLAAENDMKLMTTAQSAPELAATADRITDLLATGKVITGTGANARLQIAKALNLVGGNDDESIRNTEVLVSQLASTTLESIKSSGLGSGQGFTDKDREFLEKARAGQITYDASSLTELARLSRMTAEKSAETWNSRAKKIPSEALQGTGLSTDPVVIPKRGGVPIYATNGKDRIMSTDNGNTWKPVK